MSVKAVHKWKSNAELIADVASLGYIHGKVIDSTYGKGTFWKKYRPLSLTTNDNARDSAAEWHDDFTDMHWQAAAFDTVVFDPPYKLNGTPSDPDRRYGVHVVRTWQQRHALIRDGLNEQWRILAPKGHLLLKCQDQVCSGKVRWQTHEFSQHVLHLGGTLVDAFHFTGGRAQPANRRQVHARRNYSTLLVFSK